MREKLKFFLKRQEVFFKKVLFVHNDGHSSKRQTLLTP